MRSFYTVSRLRTVKSCNSLGQPRLHLSSGTVLIWQGVWIWCHCKPANRPQIIVLFLMFRMHSWGGSMLISTTHNSAYQANIHTLYKLFYSHVIHFISLLMMIAFCSYDLPCVYQSIRWRHAWLHFCLVIQVCFCGPSKSKHKQCTISFTLCLYPSLSPARAFSLSSLKKHVHIKWQQDQGQPSVDL